MKLPMMALLLGSMASSGANAEVVVFDYTAVVSSVTENRVPVDSFVIDGKTITSGYTLRGSFTIDLATPVYEANPDNPSSNSYGHYRGSVGNVANVTVEETGFHFQSAPSSPYSSGFTVVNSDRGDSFFYESGGLAFSGANNRFEYLIVDISDTTGLLLSHARPPTQLSIDGAGNATARYYVSLFETSKYYDATAQLTSLQLHVTPVPEPQTYPMLGIGLLAVGACARRRRRT